MDFDRLLIAWYNRNKVILLQTRVQQGLGYYSRARHMLIHRVFHVQFFTIRSVGFYQDTCLKVNLNDVHNYPVIRLIENILKKSRF